MRSYGMEVISFGDLMCQMTDLLRPRELSRRGGVRANAVKWVYPL